MCLVYVLLTVWFSSQQYGGNSWWFPLGTLVLPCPLSSLPGEHLHSWRAALSCCVRWCFRKEVWSAGPRAARGLRPWKARTRQWCSALEPYSLFLVLVPVWCFESIVFFWSVQSMLDLCLLETGFRTSYVYLSPALLPSQVLVFQFRSL